MHNNRRLLFNHKNIPKAFHLKHEEIVFQILTTYEKFFVKLCKQLDINIKIEKNFAKLIAIFLNIELNIVNIIAHLFIDKQKAVLKKINVILKTKSISYEVLELLIGLLFFICKIIIFEKFFLRHLYDALTTSKQNIT